MQLSFQSRENRLWLTGDSRHPSCVTRCGTYESLCGKYRVDFSERDKDLLDRIRIAQFFIEWEGKTFVYVGYYDFYEASFGEGGGHKEAGEGYGKHFGEHAIHRGN